MFRLIDRFFCNYYRFTIFSKLYANATEIDNFIMSKDKAIR